MADIAEKVYLIHRRDAFRGEDSTVEKLKNRDNVSFVLNSRVTKLNAGRRLESIEVTDKDGKVSTLEVSGLFVAVGRVPENQNFSSLIDLDKAGYAASSENCRTRTPGVFVAGDNRAKEVRQLVTAAADGAVAALAACGDAIDVPLINIKSSSPSPGFALKLLMTSPGAANIILLPQFENEDLAELESTEDIDNTESNEEG